MTHPETIQSLEYKLTDLTVKYNRLVVVLKELDQAKQASKVKPHRHDLKLTVWAKEKELNDILYPKVKQNTLDFLAK